MLAQMTRNVTNGEVQIQELGDERILGREAGFAKLALSGVLGIGPAPGRNQRGNATQIGFCEAEHLSDVTDGGAATIGDDVGGHGGAQFSVAIVDVLDDALALIATGKIEIYVR